jgi:hypothetical protein
MLFIQMVLIARGYERFSNLENAIHFDLLPDHASFFDARPAFVVRRKAKDALDWKNDLYGIAKLSVVVLMCLWRWFSGLTRI